MLCYFIAKKDFRVLNCVEVNSYLIEHNLEYGGKSKIVIAADPKAENEDFVVLKDGKETTFAGIIENIENVQGEKMHSISCLEIERIFDRKIFLTDADLIASAGLEDFICKNIKTYFSATGDSFVDLNYIVCNVLTHTKAGSKPQTDENVYNFKTYLGNIKEQYGIFLDFEFTKTNLIINIHKKNQTALNIDTMLTDVDTCQETYEIKALTKLSVLWDDLTNGTQQMRHFYLHTNRSVSEEDKNRVDGKISSIYLATETEEEMLEAVTNEFRSNSYSHLIEADIFAYSKIYPLEELYAGHKVTIKTSAGIKESIISGISFSNDSDVVSVKFGNLKVTLTDKLK